MPLGFKDNYVCSLSLAHCMLCECTCTVEVRRAVRSKLSPSGGLPPCQVPADLCYTDATTPDTGLAPLLH